METALDDRHSLNAEAKAGATHQQHYGSVGVYTGCVQPGAELEEAALTEEKQDEATTF